jgi:outer membrane receptor protein involved in Fe transport
MGSTAVLAATLTTGVVSAQDEDEEMLEEVVVTGSRIVRKDLNSVSPLTVTSAEDVKLSGFTKVEDLMNSLPQIEAAQNSFISNGATGGASLDLRGMGTNRTLVLINGRRIQAGGLQTAADINQIPAALVKRAEVITGGASATYGADAVAGVVNFVMDDDFEGLEITAGVSGYQHNNNNDYIQDLMDQRGFEYPTGSTGIDGKSYNIDMTMGGDFADGKGHATAYATWRKDDELIQGSRDYSSCALNAAGDWCGGSGNAIVPNFYVSQPTADGQFDWTNWDYWTLDTSGDGFIPSSGNVYNYAPVNHFMRPDERFTLGAFVDYEINEHFKPYLEVMFTRDRTDAQIAESGTFFVDNYIIPIDSDIIDDTQRQQLIDAFGIPAGGNFTAYIGKRNVEGGPRAALITHNAFRIVTGTAGELNDNWTYDASVQYGSTQYTSTYVNDFLSTAVEPAILGGDYPVFEYQGITPAAAGSMTGTGVREGISKLWVFNGFVQGDLGISLPSADDSVQVVFGTEYRHDILERTSDTVFQQGLLLGQGGPRKSVGGAIEVKELFAEAFVPLVQGAEFAQDLSLELAGRLSDYSTSGTVETYKAGLSWQPTDAVKVLASYNRAVRAPSVVELFSEQGGGLWGGVDPCSGASPELTQAQCANTGVTAAQYGNVTPSPASQYNAVYGGNLSLEPEVADTISLGTVISLDDLRLRADYWDIKLKNGIGSLAPEFIVRECGETADAAYCDLIRRGNGGSLWLGQAGSPTAGAVFATNQNIPGDAQHLRGIDISGDWAKDMGEGTLSLRMLGTYLIEKTNGTTDCAGTISTSCFPAPEWRHTFRAAYESGSFWTVQGIWRYFHSVDYTDASDVLVGDGVGSQSYFDLKATFDINENVDLLVGVNNIFDKEPPMMGSTLSTNANTIAGYYDTLGRYLHASVTLTF